MKSLITFCIILGECNKFIRFAIIRHVTIFILILAYQFYGISVALGQLPSTAEVSCEHYDASKCESNDIQRCTSIETCQTEDRPNHCFVLWREDHSSGNISVAMKGCFTENQICNQTECIDSNSASNKKNMKFCCCSGSMCNREHKWIPITTEYPEPTLSTPPPTSGDTLMILFIAISLVTLVVCFCTASIIYRNKRSAFNQIPTNDNESGNSGTELEPLSIKLLGKNIN